MGYMYCSAMNAERRRHRLLETVDRLLEIGRISEAEADQLRAVKTPADFDQAEMAIRTRHASQALRAAIEQGQMSQAEADDHLARLAKGEHPTGLRAHVRRMLDG